MNRRIGEGGEGIKRNILRPEIKGNAKRNVNCMQKGNRERMRKGESHDPPFPDLTIKQLYSLVNVFTITKRHKRNKVRKERQSFYVKYLIKAQYSVPESNLLIRYFLIAEVPTF